MTSSAARGRVAEDARKSTRDHRLSRARRPDSSRLWRPAAASSTARGGRSWPRTSARSRRGPEVARRSAGHTVAAGCPRSDRTRPPTGGGAESAPLRPVRPPETTPQGRGSARGRCALLPRRQPGRRRRDAADRRARARRRLRARAETQDSTCPEAARMASAIERSKADPSLRSSAGARLTTTRPTGQLSSAETIPLRTRSFASWQARSARPTIVRVGFPSARWASTSTRRGSRPTRACVVARPSTPRP